MAAARPTRERREEKRREEKRREEEEKRREEEEKKKRREEKKRRRERRERRERKGRARNDVNEAQVRERGNPKPSEGEGLGSVGCETLPGYLCLLVCSPSPFFARL